MITTNTNTTILVSLPPNHTPCIRIPEEKKKKYNPAILLNNY